jgi:Protein of unknown function (DUF2934)
VFDSYFMAAADGAGKAGVSSHDNVRPHICIGDRSVPCGDGRRDGATEMSTRPPVSSTIEGIMNRAHEIHRAHGGLIGYDLEDWLEAEHELFDEDRPEHFQPEETMHEEPVPCGRERKSQK